MSSTRLLRIIGIGLLAGTPLIYSGYFIFPYTLVKGAYSSLLASVGIVTILLSLRESLQSARSSLRPRLTAMHLMFLAVVAAQILAWIFSEDRSLSLWGLAGRQDGLTRFFVFYFAFLLFDSLFNSDHQSNQLPTWLMGGSALAALIAIYQWLAQPLAASVSTTGNSVFLGNFLLFSFFLCGYFYKARAIRAKWVPIAFMLLPVVGVVVSRSRGAYLGLLVGAICVFMMRSRKKFYAGCILICLSMLAVAALYSAGTLDAHLQTLISRLHLWKIALAGFLEKPLLGWGQGTYPLLFDRFYEPALIDMVADVKWSDAPHNIFLSYIYSSGIIGLTTFIGVFFLALRRIWQKNHSGSSEYSWLAGALIAYAVSGFFAIDTPEILLGLALIFALINREAPEVRTRLLPRAMRMAGAAVLGLIGLSIIAGSSWQLMLARKSRLLVNAVAGGDEVTFDAGKGVFLETHYLLPHLAVETAAKAKENYDGLAPGMRSAFRDDILALLGKADERFRSWTRFKFLLAGTLAKEASSNAASAARSEELYAEIIAASPRRQLFYLAMADLKRYQGLSAENLAYIQKAIDIYPRAIFPRVYLLLYHFATQDLDGIIKTLDGIENASAGQLERMNEFIPKGFVKDLVRVLRASGETKYAQALDETLNKYK